MIMYKLSTEIKIKKQKCQFAENVKISAIGSCFSEYISEKLQTYGLSVNSNPNGIVYNTSSILTALTYILNQKKYDDDNFIFYNELWHSWQHHGSFSNKELIILKSKISETSQLFYNHLKESDVLLLTPSSSVIYILKEKNLTVSNCHKYPNNNFTTKTLSKDDNLKNLSEIVETVKSINANIKIIITLSPVRHYPGDLMLNAKSKANLLSAIHELISIHDDIEYFPSYEIMLDELRDYRFYNDDMLHPTTLAKEIILERFVSSHFFDKAIELMQKKAKQNKFINHNKLS